MSLATLTSSFSGLDLGLTLRSLASGARLTGRGDTRYHRICAGDVLRVRFVVDLIHTLVVADHNSALSSDGVFIIEVHDGQLSDLWTQR